MRPSQKGTSSLIPTGVRRVNREVRSINSENLLVNDFRPSPGWHWQSGKMKTSLDENWGGCTDGKTSLQS